VEKLALKRRHTSFFKTEKKTDAMMGFALARQALYCMSCQPFFALVILEIGSHFLPKLAWTKILLF
jgi:hypothetical protein